MRTRTQDHGKQMSGIPQELGRLEVVDARRLFPHDLTSGSNRHYNSLLLHGRVDHM